MTEMQKCPECNGKGEIPCPMEYEDDEHTESCPVCRGDKSVRVTCPECEGKGKVEVD